MSKRVATQEKSTMVLNEGSVEPRKGEESRSKKEMVKDYPWKR